MMQKLYEDNKKRYDKSKRDADAKIEQANKDWITDQKKSLLSSDRRFQQESDLKAYTAEVSAGIMTGIVQYTKASYFSQYGSAYRNNDIFRWVIGETNDEPLAMNCWEGVLYALVKTGLVDKTYIGWCNDPYRGKVKF